MIAPRRRSRWAARALTSSYISPTTILSIITPDLLTSSGKVLIVVTTPIAASPSTDVVNVWIYPLGQQILAVANTASDTANTVSPGGIITIYGINRGPDPTPPAWVTVFAGTKSLCDRSAGLWRRPRRF